MTHYNPREIVVDHVFVAAHASICVYGGRCGHTDPRKHLAWAESTRFSTSRFKPPSLLGSHFLCHPKKKKKSQPCMYSKQSHTVC